MKKLYWIDSIEGYPSSMDAPIKESLSIYNGAYREYVYSLGYDLCFTHLEDLKISVGSHQIVTHPKYGNILQGDGAAYVGLIHPSINKEKKLESIYHLIANSKTTKLLNYSSKFPMVCKDKFRGLNIASEVGLPVPPSALLDGEGCSKVQVEFAEHVVGRYPMFVRPRDLTAGLGKRVVSHRDSFRKYLDNPPFPGRMYIAQPYFSIEAEYRVYLAGSKIVGTRERKPLTVGSYCTTPIEIRKGSQSLAEYLKTSYLCVDWLRSGSEFCFCEFETGGGFEELGDPHWRRVASAFFGKLSKT